jgi:hypothetical protein
MVEGGARFSCVLDVFLQVTCRNGTFACVSLEFVCLLIVWRGPALSEAEGTPAREMPACEKRGPGPVQSLGSSELGLWVFLVARLRGQESLRLRSGQVRATQSPATQQDATSL